MKKQKRENWMTNRIQKQIPKKTLFWCWYCDAYLIGSGNRCPNCFKKDKSKKFKKSF